MKQTFVIGNMEKVINKLKKVGVVEVIDRFGRFDVVEGNKYEVSDVVFTAVDESEESFECEVTSGVNVSEVFQEFLV